MIFFCTGCDFMTESGAPESVGGGSVKYKEAKL